VLSSRADIFCHYFLVDLPVRFSYKKAMPSEKIPSVETYQPDRRKGDRRRAPRRDEDKAREQSLLERQRKLYSLLELGQLIGLDLQLKEMLLKIAQKAAEVMEADRCSLFLHDPDSDELWSTVALGMGEEVIRIPSRAGIAGHAFRTGETLNVEDAYQDIRFNKEVDAKTGYHTRNLLCMPLYNRAGVKSGVIQLLNKKDGSFTQEDETFLKTFGTHVSVFIEIAQLQKARIDALEQAHRELERLNRVKSKALDHLSHELRTPLAVIQGNIGLLRRKLQIQGSFTEGEELFKTLEKHIKRLLDIQEETDKIIRSYRELEEGPIQDDLDRLWRRLETISEIPPEIENHWAALKGWLAGYLPGRSSSFEPIPLLPFVERVLETTRRLAPHRNLYFHREGGKDLCVLMDPGVVEEILEALLKNAVENTPDEGLIQVLVEQRGEKLILKIRDFGTGITDENQRSLFDGLFHTQDTDLYSSKRPYDFNAGGKGLDLLRLKVYGQRFGFDLAMESRRCIHLPTDRDLCPGKISLCPHCKGLKDCLTSGGSTFSVSFPAEKSRDFENDQSQQESREGQSRGK
jgi:signal transduction histidine kinase